MYRLIATVALISALALTGSGVRPVECVQVEQAG